MVNVNNQEITISIIPITSREIVEQARQFCSSITDIVIETEEEYVNCCEVTKQATEYSKKIEAERKKIVKPLNDKVKEINSFFKEAQKPLQNLERQLRQSLSRYQQKKEQERLEAQRKAEEEAEKERLRLEALAKKELEKSQKEMEKGNFQKAEEHFTKAQVKQEIAETITPPEPVKEPPKVEGVIYREKWSAKLVDKEKFISFCLQHKQLMYIDVNMKLLNKQAQTFKGKIEMPGIEFTCEKVAVLRR